MGGFQWLIIGCVVLVFLCKRLLLIGLSLFLSKKLKVPVRLGQVSLLPPSVQDCHFFFKSFTVDVDKLKLTSSLFNADTKRLLGLTFEDVRFTRDHNHIINHQDTRTHSNKEISSNNVGKVLKALTTFVQFMCISVKNITIVSQLSSSKLFHATLNHLTLDGSILPSTDIALCIKIDAFSSRVLRSDGISRRVEQCEQLTTQQQTSAVWERCMAEFSITVQTEVHIRTTNPSIQKLMVNIIDPSLTLCDSIMSYSDKHGNFGTKESNEKSWKKFLPKACELNISKMELKMNIWGQPDLLHSSVSSVQFSWQSTIEIEQLDENQSDDSVVKGRLLVQSLHSETRTTRWFTLGDLNASAQLSGGVVGASVVINRLGAIYSHSELLPWLNLLRTRERSHNPEKISTPILKIPVKLDVELLDLSASALFPQSLPIRTGVTRCQLQFNSDPCDSLVTAEIQVETFWSYLGYRTPSDPGQQNVHFWNTPWYIGLIIGKIERRTEPELGITMKSQILLDIVRFEWSPSFLNTVAAIVSSDILSIIKEKKSTNPTAKMIVRHSFSLTAASINIFMLLKVEAGLMFRIDSFAADKQWEKTLISAEGIKNLFILPGAPFSCAKSSEIKKINFHLQRIQATFRAAMRQWNIDAEIFYLNWDTRLQMCILELVEDMKSFRKLREASSSESQQIVRNSFLATLKGKICICATLSPNHRVELQSGDLRASQNGPTFELKVPRCGLFFDSNPILEAEGLVWTLTDSNEQLTHERMMQTSFQQSTNRCGVVCLSQLQFCFPYRYPFCEAFQQEFISIFKWLKQLYKKKNVQDSQLYRDLRITVGKFSLQLCDDPFEVKLRDNYDLWEDEFRESVKRKRILDAKIEELRKTHPLLTQGKIEELYGNLTFKNAEVYVQRAQRMYDGTPMRTALFRWEMENVDIIALADPSMNGYQNVVQHIQDMDPDSPWPNEGIIFTTLWCRAVNATCQQWRFLLRDFPQPLLDIKELLLIGRLAGAEQESSWRAKRTCTVHIGTPWSNVQIERGMSALKFYHDFSFDVESLSLAYGPCWEPVIAQCNLAWDFVSPPSKDPSPPLPIWDKLRLLLHGRVTMSVHQLTLLLHTSLDPYNTTEEMELTWTDLAMDWTNAKLIFKGDFNVYVRTASKYDDCRLLHLPRLKLTIRLTWHCLSDPNDHHVVTPCAPDRVPEYSSNQEHDSYRAFRSQNLTMSLSMETKPGAANVADIQALLYGSTLRWFENLKFILSGVSRPTRRGILFKNTKPKKIQLSRHYKAVRLTLSLHRFHICYWMSVSMQRGFELNCARLTLSSEHSLRLMNVEDGLKHRPRANWSIVFLNCELQEAEVWLQSALGTNNDESIELNVSLRQPVEKFYFLSLLRVSYGREAIITPPGVIRGSSPSSSDVPTHRLVVQDLRGAWTKSNREVAFALYDSWVKAQVLKRNLSPEVMKLLRFPESNVSPMKPRNPVRPGSTEASAAPTVPKPTPTAPTSVPMLQQLLEDVHHRNVVFSEDITASSRPGNVTATIDQEGVHLNWLIELVNSQVLLKGCETKGYIIISAAHAKILQRLHPPVWRDRSLVSKTSWACSLDGMQYFATINAGEHAVSDENILWLTTDHIDSKESQVVDLPDMVGSGQSVGGVISETVGAAAFNSNVQLQRIVSRCKCELIFMSYGENTLDIDRNLEEIAIPPPPSDDVMDLWAQKEEPVDSFTLTHHDLNICTNSLQYEMLLDVINNLLLYIEPHRKEASERLQRLRFQLQLSTVEDQRRPVQQLQNQLRSLISRLRRLEKETYILQRALGEDPGNIALSSEIDALEQKVYECKEQLNSANEELAMIVSCLKEAQLSANQRLQAARQGHGDVTTLRRSEINFKHAQWRLTEADGQLGIADVVLSNFLYTKLSKCDDSCEHSLEIGYVSVTNLLPNQIYKQVIIPTELNRNMPVDRQIAVRMFSRDKAPVGGICIKEIFEVNVVPFTFAMTYQFFKTMMRFCFPEKDPESLDSENDLGDIGSTSTLGKKSTKSFTSGQMTKKGKESSFYVPIEDKDDVEKMKERAEKNKLFIYIKIPEVPVKVSYKGEKEKNIEDVHEFFLVVPTLEYHNVTWTWLDLFLAMKNDSKRVLLSQAIKQKLQIRPRVNVEEGVSPQEEDKARLLLGELSLSGDTRSTKRSFFRSSK